MRRVLIHVVDGDPRRAARVATNALAQRDDVSIEIVLQGPVIDAVTAPAVWLSELPANTTLLVCANSLNTFGLDHSDIVAPAAVIPAAVAHIAEAQWAGAAYVRV